MEYIESIWIRGMMPVQFFIFLTALFLSFLLIQFLLKRIGLGIPVLGQIVLFWLAAYLFLKYVVYPPLPQAMIYNYMGLITIILFLFVSSSEEIWKAFKRPILETIRANRGKYRVSRIVVFTLLPFIAFMGTYNYVKPVYPEPVELRTVMPAPPRSIFIHGDKFELSEEHNPYRVNDNGIYSETIQRVYQNGNPWETEAPLYLKNVREGGEIYFQECHFCHGGNLGGRGMFAFAFNPIPANFTDPGTIAQLQESYVLWRVAKGGPGLPREGFPWASAMPPWEQHLTKEKIWKVILFIYWKTGYYPRLWY